MYKELIDAYAAVGVTTGRTVIVHSDFSRLRGFNGANKEAVLNTHYKALRELLGPDGTLVVHAGNLGLCNTDKPFDVDETPS